MRCRGHRLASASYYNAADFYSAVYKTATTLCKKNIAIIEVFYCFTVAIGLPGDASYRHVLSTSGKYGKYNAGSVAYAENFHGGGLVQGHMVVIFWCALFVTSQFDVISMFPNQRFGEVC